MWTLAILLNNSQITPDIIIYCVETDSEVIARSYVEDPDNFNYTLGETIREAWDKAVERRYIEIKYSAMILTMPLCKVINNNDLSISGATCKVCNKYCEFAETSENFICWPCKNGY